MEMRVWAPDHFSETCLMCADIKWQVGLLTFSALSTVLLINLNYCTEVHLNKIPVTVI